jgi:hypothetical protein
MGETRSAYRLLVAKPEGKRPLGTPRSGWEGNTEMDFHETRYEGLESFGLAQDRDK